MFEFALIIILAGIMILIGIGLWTQQRQDLGSQLETEQNLFEATLDSSDNAVVVAREYGQIVYVNDQARDWLQLRAGIPDLEYIARNIRPADSFRGLFAGDHQATFQVGKRWVEATAHTIPAENELQIVVTMREIKTAQSAAASSAFDVSISMQIIDELGETINASQGVEQTLQTILAVISKNFPIDAGEICLLDDDGSQLSQAGWWGDAAYMIALASQSNGENIYKIDEGITGQIARTFEPVLVSDVHAVDAVRPKIIEGNPYNSFVGVPLIIGERLMGTLELANIQPKYFTQAHLALLQSIATPIATAIYNAELYRQQGAQIDNLASLQQIADGHDLDNNVAGIYMALNRRIAGLLNAEMCGVMLHDERRQLVIGEPPFYGLPDPVVAQIVVDVGNNADAQQVWLNDGYWYANDLHDEPMVAALGFDTAVAAAGIQNLILMVMRIGRQPIGMLAVANKNTLTGFTSLDVQNLRILVAQAAIVIENVRLYQREQRHGTELVGLQEITHAVGALSNEDEVYVYTDINMRIAGLMGISMCGLLLFDESQNRLVGQIPFYGVDEDDLQNYEIDLGTNEAIAEIWEESDFWYTNQAQANTLIYSIGLAETFEQIGIQKTMLASLTAGGRKIGMIQVSNKLSGDDFSDNDARLLMIFATQVAAIIENARLVREVQRRADEAERLRLIAERAGNLVTLDETLTSVLSEIAQLTRSSLVFLSLIDEKTQELTVFPRAVFGAELDAPICHNQQSAGFSYTVTYSGRPLLSNNPSVDAQEVAIYRDLVQILNIQHMVIVPLMIGERRLGEMGIANRNADGYHGDDIRLMTTIAAQLASTVDRVRLFEAAGANLERRIRELDAISSVSNILNETMELDTILDSIRREVTEAIGSEGSTVAVIHAADRWSEELINANSKLTYRIGGRDDFDGFAQVEQEAIRLNGEAVIIADYAAVEMEPQPEFAASALAVTFNYANVPVGVIHLYSSRRGAFDERALTFIRTMAAKAALGYGTAVRHRELVQRNHDLRQRAEQLNQIFELGQLLQTNIDSDMMLEAIAHSVAQSVGFDVVVITMVDNNAGLLRRVTQAGLPVETFERSKADVLPMDQLDDLLKPELRISESYFYPIEKILEWQIAGLDALSAAYISNRSIHTRGPNAWRDGDMLLVPISGAGGELLGIISLDRPHDNRRPDPMRISLLEIFAHQAASTIENNRLYLNTMRNAETEARLSDILSDIASTLDINEIIELVAHNALRLAPFRHMTVALADDTERGYDVIRVEVKNDDSLVMTRGRNSSLEYTALGRSIKSGVDYVYTPHNDIAAYKDLSRWHEEGETISLVMPLTAGGETLGAMHFGSNSEEDFDLNEFRTLFGRVAQIMAVAIQNARLFNQAVELRIFNESIVESIQQGIVVLDQSGRVISANQFMQDEYGWDLNQMRKDIFDYSPELAEVLADQLRVVLETGEPQRILNERSELFDSYMVRSFYMYPLVSQEKISGAVLLIEDVTERAKLEENLQEQTKTLSALTEASGKITASLKRDEVIDLALDAMREVVDYDTMTLWRREGDFMRLVGVSGVNVSLTPPLRSPIKKVYRLEQIIKSRAPFNLPDLPTFLRTHSFSQPGDSGMGSWMGVPLVNRSEVVGMIALAKTQLDYYTEGAERAALAFANQVAVALTNADLYTDTAARTERLSILNRVSLALVQSMDTETIFEVALNEIAFALKSEYSQAILFDMNGEVGRVMIDAPRGEVAPTQTIALRQSATFRYLLKRMKPLVYSHDITNMTEAEPLEDDLRLEIEQRGLRDYLLVPMMAPGYMIGAFEFETRTDGLDLSPDTLEIASIIANQTAIAVQNANQLDELTNRTRELEMLLEAAQSTLLTMDLPEVFKTVADLFINALDVDDCAILLLIDVENSLEVQIDVNRSGDNTHISPRGTKFDLSKYPSRSLALRTREVVVVKADDLHNDPAERADFEHQGDHIRMFVPLVIREQAFGLIQVEIQDNMRAITKQEERLARALGAQVAVAIYNARLSAETAAQVDELFLINDLSQSLALTLNIEDMLRSVAEHVPNVTEANQMYVALYDKDTGEITFPLAIYNNKPYDIPPRQLGTDEVSFVINKKRPLNLGGDYFTANEVRSSMGLANGEGKLASYLAVPLVAGDQVFGVLAVRDDERKRLFGLNDQRILTTVGSQLGAALQNAQLFEQLQRSREDMKIEVDKRTEELQEERDRLDMLYQITAELALTLDMDRVLSRALQMMASAVRAHDGVIMLIDPMTDRLYNRASLSRTTTEGNRITHPAEAIATWLIANDHELLVNDLHQESYWDRHAPDAEDWRSAMAVLLETNEDVQGVLVLLSRDIRAFSEPLLNLVIAAANQVASAINNADLYQLIRDQAERLGTLLRTEQEEAEKSNAILESIADGVMLLDQDGQINLFNSAAEEMLLLPRDQVMGRSLSELTARYGDNVRDWVDPILQWTQDADSLISTGIFPSARLTLNERVINLMLSAVTSSNQHLGTVAVFRDITRDVEVDNLKNEFILNVTHELRTPMTSIKGYAEMMLLKGMTNGITDDYKTDIMVIKNNADRLAALIEDLLTISKLDSGKSPLNVEPVDMAEIIHIQLTNARNRHFDKNLMIGVDIDDSLPRAALDRGKTHQIISNIIDNAFNYTPAGGKIDISLHRDPKRERHLLFTVADTGLGIPKDFQEKIWDRFARNDSHALDMEIAGTGLGLSIVRDLVQMHEGHIWFDSTENVGTTFYVTLPIEHKRSKSSALNVVSGD